MGSSAGVGRADAAPQGDLNGSRRKFASGTFYDQESFSFSSKCQNFLRVWNLVNFRADQ